MKSRFLYFKWPVFCVFILVTLQVSASLPLLVDDSYTVSERFERYKKQDPSLRLPIVSYWQQQKVLFDLTYKKVNNRALHLDLFQKVGDKSKGVIVLIHGGGWRSGNKSHFYPMATKLAQSGYDVVVPEYRLSIESPYPSAVEDLHALNNWLQAQAQYFAFNLTKLVIGGGSSGGHLAALVSFRNNCSHAPSCVNKSLKYTHLVDLDGILDTTDPKSLKFENKKGDKSALALWLGGSFEAQEYKWRAVSPVIYLDQNTPNTLVISSGQPRFTIGKEKLANHLKQLNKVYKYYEFKNIIHTFWLFEPYLTQTVTQIEAFLEQ